MAEKKKYTISKNGKDFDFDLSEFDNNIKDDFSFEAKVPKGRSPIGAVRQLSSSAMKSSLDALGPAFERRLQSSMPKTSTLVGEGVQFANDLTYMSKDFMREVDPSIQQLKRAGKQLGPKIKMFLPEFAHKYYDKLVETTNEQDNYKPDKEKEQERSITSTLDGIFSKQIKTSLDIEAERKKDNLIERSVAANRHKQSFEQLRIIRTGAEFHINFVKQVQLPYMKKDLEIKLRHLFIAKETNQRLQHVAEIIEDKLQAIQHNTSLPDIQKQTQWETTKTAIRERLASRMSNWPRNIINKVKQQVFDPIKEGIALLAEGAETVAEFSSNEFTGGKSSRAQLLGKGIGMAAGNFLPGMLMRKIIGTRDKPGIFGFGANNLEEFMGNFKMRAMLKMQNLARKHEGTALGTLLSILSPDLPTDAGSVKNTQLNTEELTSWKSKDSIALTTVIPGLLAKSLQQLMILNSGDKNIPELVYDYSRNDFISATKYQAEIVDKAVGSAEERKRQLVEIDSDIKGTAIRFGGLKESDIATFDKLIPDLNIFISNIAQKKWYFDENLIKGIADTASAINQDITNDSYKDEVFRQSFIREAFNGVKDKTGLLQMLYSMIFNSDGTTNEDVVRSIGNAVNPFIANDKYLEVLEDLAKKGHIRFARQAGLIESHGTSFKASDTKFRDLFAGVDLNIVASDLDEQTQARIAYINKYLIKPEGESDFKVPDSKLKTFILNVAGWFKDQDFVEKFKRNTPEGVQKRLSPLVNAFVKTHAKGKEAAKLKETEGLVWDKDETSQSLSDELDIQYRNVNIQRPGDKTNINVTPLLKALDNINKTLLNKVIKTEVTNFNKIDKFNVTATSTTEIKSTDTVNAIEKFRSDFNNYVNNQSSIPDLLGQLLSTSALQADTLKTMLSGFVQGDFKTIKAKVGDISSSVLDSLKKIPGKAYGLTKRFLRFSYIDMPKKVWEKGKELWEKYDIGGKLGRVPGMAMDVLGWGKDKVVGATTFAWNTAGGIMQRMKDRTQDYIYIDIYRKDEVDPKNPLLTARQQKEGVIFSDGKKVLTSYAIDRPVLSKDGQVTLISQEDIEHGLVNIHNKSLADLSKSGIAKHGKSILKSAGNLLSQGLGLTGDLAQLAGKLGTQTLKLYGQGLSMMGKGVAGVWNTVTGRFGRGGISGDAPQVVDRLDIIIAILNKKFGYNIQSLDSKETDTVLTGVNDVESSIRGKEPTGDIKPGDEDGDGSKDTIFEARKKKLAAREEAREDKEKTTTSTAIKDIAKTLKGEGKEGKKGIFGKMLGLLGGIGGFLGTITRGLFGLAGGGLFGLVKGIFGLTEGIFKISGGLLRGIMTVASSLGGSVADILGNLGGGKLGKMFRGMRNAGKGIAAGGQAMGMGGKLLTTGAGIEAKAGMQLMKSGSKAAGARMIGAAAARGMAGLGMRMLGGLVGGPVGWAITAASIGSWLLSETDTGRKITNWLGVTDNDFQIKRAELYGINKDGEGFMNNPLRYMVELEEATYNAVAKGKKITDDDLRDFANKFLNSEPDEIIEDGGKEGSNINPVTGLPMSTTPKNPVTSRMQYFTAWYKRRFLPIFTEFFNLLTKHKVDYSSIDEDSDVSDEVRTKIYQELKTKASAIIAKCAGLVCTPKAYKEYLANVKKEREAQKKGTSTVNKSAIKMAKEEMNISNAARAKTSGSSIGMNMDSAHLAAINNMSANMNQAAAVMNAKLGEAGMAADFAMMSAMFGGNTVINTGRGGDKIDLDKINVPKLGALPGGGNNGLGEYVAKFESGRRGSLTVAWDSTGGTSYGKYQHAAKVGGTKAFIDWCAKNGGSFGKAFADAMYKANDKLPNKGGKHGFDTGSKNGPTVDVWKKFASDPGFATLEHQFIKSKYYDVALGKLNGELQGLVQGDRGLQESLWSTAVQHGPGGAVKIFSGVYKPGMSKEDYIKAIYEKRGNSFPSSTQQVQQAVRNRFKEEIGIILALSQGNAADTSGNIAGISPDSSPGTTLSDAKIGDGSANASGGDSNTPGGVTPVSYNTGGGASPGVSSDTLGGGSPAGGPPRMGVGGSEIGPGSIGTGPSSSTLGMGAVQISDKDAKAGYDKLKKKPGVSMNYGPAMQSALGKLNAAYMEKFGSPMLVTSGTRSLEKQRELYAKYGPGRAARPNPNAPHIKGYAIDINSADLNKAEKAGLLEQFGLHRPFWPRGKGRTPPESWHLELKGARTGAVDLDKEPQPEPQGGVEPTSQELANKKDVVPPSDPNATAPTVSDPTSMNNASAAAASGGGSSGSGVTNEIANAPAVSSDTMGSSSNLPVVATPTTSATTGGSASGKDGISVLTEINSGIQQMNSTLSEILKVQQSLVQVMGATTTAAASNTANTNQIANAPKRNAPVSTERPNMGRQVA